MAQGSIPSPEESATGRPERARRFTRRAPAVLLDDREQLIDVDRLREITVESRLLEPLDISLHRLRGYDEHRYGGGSLIHPQPAQRLHAVHVRQPNVHQ